MQSTHDTKGVLISLDMWGVHPVLLNSAEFLSDHMKAAIEKCGATIVSEQYKKFSPQGVTILYLLEESHFSIHTYPPQRFASVDIYTCGSANPQLAIDHMIQMLAPEQHHTKTIIRGDKGNPLTEVS